MYVIEHNGGTLTCADDFYEDTVRDYKINDNAKRIHLTDEEWNACGGLARIFNGEIFLGKTDLEIEEEKVAATVAEYQKNLINTDYICMKISEKFGDEEGTQRLKEEYADILAKREEWRQYINDHTTKPRMVV